MKATSNRIRVNERLGPSPIGRLGINSVITQDNVGKLLHMMAGGVV